MPSPCPVVVAPAAGEDRAVPPVPVQIPLAAAAATPEPMDGLDREDDAPVPAAAAVPPPFSPDPGLVAPTDCCAKGGKGKAGEDAIAAALVAAAADEGAEEACNPAMWAVSPSMSLRNCNISCGVRLDNSRRSSSAVKVGRL